MPDMFKPYDATAVPDIMPFPALLRVATTKAQETPMSKDDLKAFYDTVKTDAFAAKAFQHTVQAGDPAEEAHLAAHVQRWLIANPPKMSGNKKSKKSTDGNDSDVEEDEGARVGCLRGYPRAGWRLAIQNVMTNKRTAEQKKRNTTTAEKTDVVPPPLAMAKLFGITAQTGRDKFHEEHREEIRELSKMLPGAMNAGRKNRKAEAQLWANENHEDWDIAAMAEEGVNWAERQELVTGAVQHMVEMLNTNERGELQLEWVEALPQGLKVPQRYENQWATQPLQEYAAARNGRPEAAAPVFALTDEALNDMTPHAVARAVTAFLTKSHQAAFGDEIIPWARIASKPDETCARETDQNAT
ncbi:hypothetical protein C8F04DRAFT_1266134 [Mycena alexandri]|uniref:Uncharacterized protein n=1 Tax=Mycena alexandri TaxID=1745969 RepID=A0AAD6SJ90_9AGAR|nr:hypothetical protein C8F04DRAFT_1266134 [Mycena alexandri]